MSEAAGLPERSPTIASDETRDALIDHPKVLQGLKEYFDRDRRYGGNIPTISAAEALARLTSTSN